MQADYRIRVTEDNLTAEDAHNTKSNAATNHSPEPHVVRVRQGAKLKPLIEYSLKFLNESPGRPLLLHTLPAEPKSSDKKVYLEAEVIGDTAMETHVGEADSENENAKHKKTSPVTSTVSRLVSVVEVIKRQYLEKLVSGIGLHQYNFLGYLEQDKSMKTITEEETEEERAQTIAALLTGQNHLQIKRTPFMKIILCTKALSDDTVPPSFSYQPPLTKKMSKKSKAKLRRRAAQKEKSKGREVGDSANKGVHE